MHIYKGESQRRSGEGNMPNMLKDIKQIEFPFFARFDDYQEAYFFANVLSSVVEQTVRPDQQDNDGRSGYLFKFILVR